MNETTRRRFLGAACAASGCAACSFGVVPVVTYLVPPPASTAPIVVRLPVRDVPEGQAKIVRMGPKQILVVRHDGQWTAVDSKCTDLGCTVVWDPQAKLIRCPCHNGVFDADGRRVSGPPPTDLHKVQIRVEGDRIVLEA
ncbi:MAG: ubiquinol-cytochrome c reductase iron-sulfur subunit [Planctomycetes bacterium]|nr:ubiquinol-cytochrome c reductase iron-sulfur subunit [Planctomycetota bacterium]